MNFRTLAIGDVNLIEPRVFEDARGEFFEAWSSRDFAEHGLKLSFVQDNVSRSTHGVLRGLHYQIEKPQGKLVRCTLGTVFDVAVDLRRSSPTFGQWVGEELSAQNRRSMWIPPGFAHGFVVQSDSALFEYKCTEYYQQEHDRTIKWDDADLAIDWKLGAIEAPIVSEKDAQGAAFSDAEVFA